MKSWFSSHKLHLIIIAALVVLTGLITIYVTQGSTTNNNTNSQIEPGPVTVQGTIVCLPHKGSGPHTAECAFGLHGQDGNFYALTRLNQDQLINGDFAVQTKVEVGGHLSSPPENSTYDIVGTIEIQNITVISSVAMQSLLT